MRVAAVVIGQVVAVPVVLAAAVVLDIAFDKPRPSNHELHHLARPTRYQCFVVQASPV